MKTLVVYFSRTGHNAQVAKEVKEKLSADFDEITESEKYGGILGYLKGGFRGARKKKADSISFSKDPSKYDKTIILYPVWGGKMPPAIRTYLSENKVNDLVLVSVSGGGGRKMVKDLEETATKSVKAFTISDKEFKAGSYQKELELFLKNLS